MADLEGKLARLRGILREMGGAVIALSGGTDSSLLLDLAAEVLDDRVLAVTARGPMFPAAEAERAGEVAGRAGVRHAVIDPRLLEDDGVRANPPDRCYHCKRALFGRLLEMARGEGLRWVAHGEQADDASAHRPGARAADELGVRAPLAEAGLTKQEVRELSRRRGLPTWDAPASACLATRIPYGQELTEERLARVEAAEDALREVGFRALRVRDHGGIARIEVPQSEIQRLTAEPLRLEVVARLRALGFTHVTVDLAGLRSGSMDEGRG